MTSLTLRPFPQIEGAESPPSEPTLVVHGLPYGAEHRINKPLGILHVQPHSRSLQYLINKLRLFHDLPFPTTTTSVPRTGRRRVPSGRLAGSLAVTPRRPNPIAPTSLRSDRATYSGADLPAVAPHRRFGYHAACPAVRPRSTPLAVADVSTVALAALAATLRTRRTSPDQSTFLHAPAIRQSHAEPPIPPCLPLTASVPRTGRRRVPSGRSESSLAVTPRRPNPIAPSSLRSGRARCVRSRPPRSPDLFGSGPAATG